MTTHINPKIHHRTDMNKTQARINEINTQIICRCSNDPYIYNQAYNVLLDHKPINNIGIILV